MLADLGVKRVVLAREMSLDEIERIGACGTETEVFVHGALCICYSGQCLMSSMIGGRSGNRGYCAQPCRRAYSLKENGRGRDTGGKYLLSPKDLCAARLIPALAEAGVTSFKIEGRMKRPEYVAGVVRTYRTLIDRYVADPGSFRVSDEEIEYLLQLFNRGFTSSYPEGRKSGLMSRDNPANRGLELGEVLGCDRGRVRIRLHRSLRQGDGISTGENGIQVTSLFRDNRRVKEASAGDIVEIPSPPVEKGVRVYRTSDSQQLDTLQKTFTSPHPLRKVPVDIEARIVAGKPVELRLEADCCT
jgi:putative protease